MTQKEENERQKICRQVASLFALTTSSVTGEAQSAKDTVKRLVKAHTLTFADVSPYGNEIALKVMRSFWSIAETTQAAQSRSEAQAADPDAQTIQDMIDRLRREYTRSYTPYNPWDVFGQPSYGCPAFRQEPPLSVEWQGKQVPVTALDSDALSYLILEYEGQRDWVERLKNKAHDAIEQERLDDAVAYLTRIQQNSARVTKEVYQGLLKEQEERIRRRSDPYWTGGFSGPTW